MDRTAGVRFRYRVLAILFATSVSAYAQAGPSGRWSARRPCPFTRLLAVEQM